MPERSEGREELVPNPGVPIYNRLVEVHDNEAVSAMHNGFVLDDWYHDRGY